MERPWRRRHRKEPDRQEDHDGSDDPGQAQSGDVPRSGRAENRRVRRERRITETRPDEEDLEQRLGALSFSLGRPPTAEELRAAFGVRRRDPAARQDARSEGGPSAEEPPQPSFADQYPVESLFVHAGEDAYEDLEDRTDDDGGASYYDPADAWAVLGVDPAADWSTIVAAHRRLALEHHPDRLQALTPEERRESEELMREVNIAYTVLRRLRET